MRRDLFPSATNREAWNALPAAERGRMIAAGEAALGADWPQLTAALMLGYVRTGDRNGYQTPHFARRKALERLVLAECVEGRGRFVDAIADCVWSTCEESYWGWPAHLNMQLVGHGLADVTDPTVDLGVCETVGLLSWTVALLRESLDGVSPLLVRRIVHEAKRRVLEPCLGERAPKWIAGVDLARRFNNWTPWCCSNWLSAALLLEEDDSRLDTAVTRILASLEAFIAGYGDDGGCDEGPGYWSRAAASLFDCLDLLDRATEGGVNWYGRPRIAAMARYIQQTHIADNWFVNFADAGARVEPDGVLVARFAARIGDDSLAAFGGLFQDLHLTDLERPESMFRTLGRLFDPPRFPKAPCRARDAWFKDLELMVARDDDKTDRGFVLAAKAGHNNDSHNHNDVGQFIVFLDGEPALIDAGVGTYTSKTFSPQRYDIWTMQSAWHNLPTINGVMQKAGRDFAAKDVVYQMNDARAELQMNLASAYPPEAKLVRWDRRVSLRRGEGVELSDAFELVEPDGEVMLSLLMPAGAQLVAPGEIKVNAARVRFDPRLFEASVEPYPIDDAKLERVWGNALTRATLTWRGRGREGAYHIRVTR